MNFLMVSPHFPPNFQRFSRVLREAGARVFGVGDAPWEDLGDELRPTLEEYCHVPNMDDYDAVHRATAYLVSRHGRMDRVDSHSEHWLGLEARLRRDFNIEGQRPEDLEVNRRKSGMKEVFRRAGVPTVPGEPVTSPEGVRAFAKRHGFPLIFKPDVGVGAQRILRVDDKAGLEVVLGRPLDGYFVETFFQGDIVTFDGLTDREGGIVFCASHKVSSGIMEIIAKQSPVHYYYLRQTPPEIEELGRRTVRAFRIRERFFHAEFLVGKDGGCVGLEVNVRPPGGYSLDMMDWACDIDLYAAWARCVVRGEGHFEYQRKYNVAHVGRRDRFRYRRGMRGSCASWATCSSPTCPCPRSSPTGWAITRISSATPNCRRSRPRSP